MRGEALPPDVYDARKTRGTIYSDLDPALQGVVAPRENVLPPRQVLESQATRKQYGLGMMNQEEYISTQKQLHDLELESTKPNRPQDRDPRFLGPEGSLKLEAEKTRLKKMLQKNSDIYNAETSLEIDDPKADLVHHARVLQKVADEKFGGDAGKMFRNIEREQISQYLNPEQREQYGLVNEIQVLASARLKRMKAGDIDGALQAEKDITSLTKKYKELENQRLMGIDKRIKELTDSMPENAQQSADNIKEIQTLEAQKELMFMPEAKREAKLMQIMGVDAVDGMKPRDVLRLALHSDRLKYEKALGGFSNPTLFHDKATDLRNQLRLLAPAVLLNRNPIDSADKGFFSTIGAEYGKMVGGEGLQVEKSQKLSGELQALGIDKALTPKVEKALNITSQDLKPYGSEDWGRLVGGSLRLATEIAATAPLTEGASALLKIPQFTRALSMARQAGRIGRAEALLGETMAHSLKTGANYWSAGQVFKNDQDELTFMSGMLGGVLAIPAGKATTKVAELLGKKAAGLFAEQTPSMVKAVQTYAKGVGQAGGKAVSGGVGEVAEEFGNQLGSILDKSSTMQEFLSEVGRQFGDLDATERMIIQSFVAGSIMGEGTTMGKALLNHSEARYAEASREQRDFIDGIKEKLKQEAEQMAQVEQEADMREKAAEAAGVDLNEERFRGVVTIDDLAAKLTPDERSAAGITVADDGTATITPTNTGGAAEVPVDGGPGKGAAPGKAATEPKGEAGGGTPSEAQKEADQGIDEAYAAVTDLIAEGKGDATLIGNDKGKDFRKHLESQGWQNMPAGKDKNRWTKDGWTIAVWDPAIKGNSYTIQWWKNEDADKVPQEEEATDYKTKWPLTHTVSDDPVVIASEYLQERDTPSDFNKVDLAVRDSYGTFTVTEEDWNQYADRNTLDDAIKRGWIRANANPLDTTAQEISEMAGYEITPEDLIAHIRKFPDGKANQYISPRARELAARYAAVTATEKKPQGTRLDAKVAKRLLDKYREKSVYAPQIKDAINAFTDETGAVNWAALNDQLTNDPEFFKGWPFDYNDEQIQQLRDIVAGKVASGGNDTTQKAARTTGSTGQSSGPERAYEGRLNQLREEVRDKKKALVAAQREFNSRGMTLFPEDEGSQTVIEGAFDNSPENYARVTEPLAQALAVAQDALDTHVRNKEKYIAQREAANQAQLDIDSQINEERRDTGKNQDPVRNVTQGAFYGMSDAELEAFFDARYGKKSKPKVGQFGRGSKYTFRDFDHFKQWMDERYAERDLDGMKEAFAEVDNKLKVQYVRDALKNGDDHKRAWVAHIGTAAPLPVEDPPMARTTPRPMPNGTYAPPPRRPSSNKPPDQKPPEQKPPPPPRTDSAKPKFDIMALVQLMRMFMAYPVMNTRMRKAFGSLEYPTGKLSLMERLLWDTKLATRVLGHEIGHFVDMMIEHSGFDKKFHERIAPLKDFKKDIEAKKELRAQARALSAEHRGPFKEGDPYRDSSAELFADFMSMLFINPDNVNKKYPLLYDHFNELMRGKPEFKKAYETVVGFLTGDTLTDEWMKQQEQGVEQTLDDLTAKKDVKKEGFVGTLKGAVSSIWYRAKDIEKSSRNLLGDRFQDLLERSGVWGNRQDALFVDEFQRTVKPLLDRVNADPIKARAIMHQYLQANRTINERRAAGLWVEEHPEEAREMLLNLIKLDPIFTKYKDSVLSAQPDELYDLTAEMLRTAFDRGEKYAARLGREIDKMDLGVKGEDMLLAFNVRGKLLNPGGLTVPQAEKVIENLKSKLSTDQFDALTGASDALTGMLFRVQAAAYHEGLIAPSTWNEVILPNKGNYVPYAVLDYWDAHVGAGIRQQTGTAKDIGDTVLTSQLKASAMNHWRQRQRQVRLLVDMYRKAGFDVDTTEKLRKASDIINVRERHIDDDKSRAVIYINGEPHVAVFPNDPGKTFETALESPDFYRHFGWMTKAHGALGATMQLFTTYNPAFWTANVIRGVRTSMLRLGIRNVLRTTFSKDLGKARRLAVNYARVSHGKETMDPELRRMIENEALPPPMLSPAAMRRTENVRDLLAGNVILANQVRENMKDDNWFGFLTRSTAGQFVNRTFAAYEAMEKILNMVTAERAGMDEKTAVAVTERSGIPKPTVGGRFSLITDVIFPWTRVKIQGLRASKDFAMDPRLKKQFAARFILLEVLPRLVKVGIATGIAKAAYDAMKGDGEDDDKLDASLMVTGEALRRMSPYKLALDDSWPIGFYNPSTGKHTALWQHFDDPKNIPSELETVSLRIPSSEEGREWGSLAYQLVASGTESLRTPGIDNPLKAGGAWFTGQFLPGINPLLKTVLNEGAMISGVNPIDPLRQRPVANKDMFDAGGWDRVQTETGYLLNNLGAPGQMAALLMKNSGALRPEAVDPLSKRMMGDPTPLFQEIPFASRLFSYDNYQPYRDRAEAEADVERVNAQARLMMEPEVKEMYDFAKRNEKKYQSMLKGEAHMSDKDIIRYHISKTYGERWGAHADPENPSNLFSKAAYVASGKGSVFVEDSVKQEIARTAEDMLRFFKDPELVNNQNEQSPEQR